jgi:hypothetical protein
VSSHKVFQRRNLLGDVKELPATVVLFLWWRSRIFVYRTATLSTHCATSTFSRCIQLILGRRMAILHARTGCLSKHIVPVNLCDVLVHRGSGIPMKRQCLCVKARVRMSSESTLTHDRLAERDTGYSVNPVHHGVTVQNCTLVRKRGV